jgi:hypothetical protein
LKQIEREFRQANGERFQDRIEVGYTYQELDGMPDGYAIPERRIKPWGTARSIAIPALPLPPTSRFR